MYRVKDITKQQQKFIEKYKRLCILRDLFVKTNSGKTVWYFNKVTALVIK